MQTPAFLVFPPLVLVIAPPLVLLCSLLFLPGSELGCSLVCLGYFFSSSPYVTTFLFLSEMLLDCNPSSNPATPKPRFAILIAMQSVLGLWHRPRPKLSSSIEPSTPSLLSFHSSLFLRHLSLVVSIVPVLTLVTHRALPET